MLSFKQFLLENEKAAFRMWNHLFAMDDEGALFHHSAPLHSEAFPDMFDAEDGPKGGVLAWGRIGWDDKGNGIVSVTTDAGRKPGESGFLKGNKKALENDIFTRVRAIEEIEKEYPDTTLLIHHGPGVMHTPTEHKKHLMSLLGER